MDDEHGTWIEPGVLLAATTAGAVVDTFAGRGVVEHVQLGDVRLPSGQLVAYDPSDWAPRAVDAYVQAVPPGAHPVELRVLHFDDGDARTLCALVRFGDGEPERWELALRPGQDLADLEEGAVFAYSVDGGIACFCDPLAGPRLLAMVEAWIDDERSDFALHEAMKANRHTTWDWAAVDLDDGVNVVVFSTGLGDGMYPVWLGYERDAALPVVAVTEFGLVAGSP